MGKKKAKKGLNVEKEPEPSVSAFIPVQKSFLEQSLAMASEELAAENCYDSDDDISSNKLYQEQVGVLFQ